MRDVLELDRELAGPPRPARIEPAPLYPDGGTLHLSTNGLALSRAYAGFAAGSVREARRDLDGAMVFYEDAVSHDDRLDGVKMRLATHYFRNGQFDRSLGHLAELASIDSTNAAVFTALALAHAAGHDPDAARDAAQKALQLDAQAYGAHAILYDLDRRAIDHRVAEVELAARAGRAAKRPEFWERTGEAFTRILVDHYRMNRRESAELAAPLFEKAASFPSARADLLNRTAEMLVLRDDFEGAAALVSRSLKLEPRNAQTKLNLVFLLAKARRFDKATKLAGPDATLLVRVAQSLEAVQDYEAAVPLLQHAVEGRPRDVDLLQRLAVALAGASRIEEAALTLEQVLKVEPERGSIYVHLASLYSRLGQNDKALALFQEARSRGEPLEVLADVAIASSNFVAAASLLEEASQQPGAGEKPWLDLATVHFMQSNITEAITVLERAGGRFPYSSAPLFQASLYARHRRDWDTARRLIADAAERAGHADPELQADIHFQWGIIEEQSGRHDQAALRFQQTIELNPRQHEAMNYLAYMWAERGERLEEALLFVQRALDMEPENPAYIDTLGWIYYQQGRYELALDKILLALRLCKPGEDDPEIYDHLGSIHAKLNQWDKALAAWEKTRAEDPQYKGIEAKIDQARRALENAP